MSTYSEEIVYRLWDDGAGERIEVGEDLDGLGLIEVKNIDSTNCVTQILTLTHEQALWLKNTLPLLIKEPE